MNLSEKIRYLRIQKGMTQADAVMTAPVLLSLV